MKKLSFLLILVLLVQCLLCAVPAQAESSLDAFLADAVFAAGQMQAAAANTTWDRQLTTTVNSISHDSYLHPIAAAAIAFPSAQLSGVQNLLSCTQEGIVSALNQRLNVPMDDRYANVAGHLSLLQYAALKPADNTCAAVLLAYEWNLCLVLYTPDGMMQALFLLPDGDLSGRLLDESTWSAVLSGYGLAPTTATTATEDDFYSIFANVRPLVSSHPYFCAAAGTTPTVASHFAQLAEDSRYFTQEDLSHAFPMLTFRMSASPSGSTSVSVAPDPTPAPARDLVAEAQAQGMVIPAHFAPYPGPNNTFTFYSTDYDNGINMKSKPEDGRSDVFGSIMLPFNGTLVGTAGSWDLVEKNGQFCYIYAPIVGKVSIPAGTSGSDYSAILNMARSQGKNIPADFYISSVANGQMLNYSGTPTYAIYKYDNPYTTESAESYGKFYFYNDSNPNTYNYKSWVSIYGYYNGRALCYHDGEFFWCNPSFFQQK